MKPEELDELFRRGLADQQLPPRPSAWAAVQQRLAAPDASDATAATADSLPAFLRNGASVAPPPASLTRPVPLMTASRGGAALPTGGVTAPATGGWWQRPAMRAAAAVVLLVGGSLLLRTNPDPSDSAGSAVPEVATAVEDIAPAAFAPTTAAEEAPVTSVIHGVTNDVAAADAPPSDAEITPETTTATPVAFTALRTLPAVRAAAPTATRQDTRLSVSKIGGASTRHATRHLAHAAPAPVQVATAAPLRRTTADSQAIAAHTARVRRQAASAASGLTVGEAADATLAAASPAPAPHGFVNVRRGDLRPSYTADVADDETIEVDGGTIGQLVARATGRPMRITSPNALLRRGAGRMRELLDRADHTVDGQLTLETSVVGRSVRKTISL